jgi:V8-like Glu-specific endopeptidase
MFEITNRTTPPYSSICYVRAEWSDGTASRASAVIVGYNDVLTALHAVFDLDKGGWATKVTITPAADTSPFFVSPYGQFSDVGSMVGRAANWDLNGDGLLTQAESQGDLALLGMKSRIGDITGWLPVVQMPNDFNGVMAGYPARGTGLMAESVFADASSQNTVYNVQSGLGAGASGGPLLHTDAGGVTSVAGILSSGNTSNTTSTYAGLFSASTWSWLHGAMSANDNLLPNSGTVGVPIPGGLAFTGSSAADTFAGGTGWDQFTGNGGNDTVAGGEGIDTAFYTGSRATYGVASASGRITVADLVASRDGTDTLTSVERLAFADVRLAFDVSGSAGKAYRLYQTAFDRTPDNAGLGFQMKALDDGLSLTAMANNFINSPEFVRTYGSLSNAQFITQLYANVLNRTPDAGGFAYHTGNLASGANSRADVVVGFSESPENQAALIGAMQNGMVYTV